MFENELPKQKKSLTGRVVLMAVVDLVLSVFIAANWENFVGVYGLVAVQLAVGLALIAFGGESRAAGKVLVYGLGAAVAIVVGLGFLVFAVCGGTFR